MGRWFYEGQNKFNPILILAVNTVYIHFMILKFKWPFEKHLQNISNILWAILIHLNTETEV